MRRMSQRVKGKSRGGLAQKIAEEFLSTSTTPHVADTEDIVDNDDTNARALEFDSEGEEYESTVQHGSALRKRNAALLEDIDEKYAGKKVSRKTLYPDEERFSGSEDELELDSNDVQLDFFDAEGNDDEDLDMNDGSSDYDNDDREDDSDNMEDDNGERDEAEEESNDDGSSGEDGDDVYDADISSFLKKAKIASMKSELEKGGSCEERKGSDEEEERNSNVEQDADRKRQLKKEAKTSRADAELQQGQAVQNQIRIWEQLLEIRIEIQKMLNLANKLPQFDTWSRLKEHPEILPRRRVIDTEHACLELCSCLLDLQRVLEGGGSHERAGKITLTDMDKEITHGFEKIQAKRNNDIQKWDDKTRLTRLAQKKSGDVLVQSVLNQISHVLENRSRILNRTRQNRNNLKVIGKPELPPPVKGPRRGEENPELPLEEVEETSYLDAEIYNDDDFYQQLLRELIQQKTNDEPAALSQKWLDFQNEKKKNKKVVDIRATKGRKLRFDIKPKLVNYMASYRDPTHWDDVRRDDLFSSLFGAKPEYKDDSETGEPESVIVQEGEPLILR